MINRLAKLASAVAASGLALAGLGLAATASAQGPSYQGGNCPPGQTCTHWLPGQPPPPGGQATAAGWQSAQSPVNWTVQFSTWKPLPASSGAGRASSFLS